MSVDIKMPALSPTMTEGRLSKWLVKAGDNVRSGDVIAEIETDKATMEVEAIEDGKIGQILVPAGTQHIKVNAVIALLLEVGESAGEMKLPTTDAPGKPLAAPVADDTTASAETAPMAEPVATPVAETEWSGSSTSLTVRESLRDAMAEEMRRDENVFIMGEEVAEYQGAYKVTQGLLDEFGAKRVIAPDTAYVDISYKQALALSTAYQAGIVAWVAFWVFYGQGFTASTLSSVLTFGMAYMMVVLIEPLVDLAVLAGAKSLRDLTSSQLFNRRLLG